MLFFPHDGEKRHANKSHKGAEAHSCERLEVTCAQDQE